MVRDSGEEATTGGMGRRSVLKTLGAAGLAAGGLGGATSLMGQPVAAATGSVIDDFDDGDLSEYTQYRQEGATIVSSPTASGAGALALDATSTDIVSQSGLASYPEAGDTFSVRVRWTAGTNSIQFIYGLQTYQEYSDQEYYKVVIDPDNDDVVLKRQDLSGKYKLKKKFSVGMSPETWYELEVDWQTDGTHTVTLFDDTRTQVTQLSATDSTWTSGGIGFFSREANTGASVYFDEAVIGNPAGSISYAADGILVDDFEQGDLNNYSVYREGPASVTSDIKFNGSKALKVDGTAADLVSLSGLPHYPKAGDKFSVRLRWTPGAEALILAYGIQKYEEYSEYEHYLVTVRPSVDQVALKKWENGSKTKLSKKFDVGLQSNQWYTLTVDWGNDGTHNISLSDSEGLGVTELSATDTTYVSGGIGLFGREINSGATDYFDAFVIESRNDTGRGAVLEDFEVESLNAYHFESSESGISLDSSGDTLSTKSFYEGSTGLKITESDRLIVKDTGLRPAAGSRLRFWTRFSGNTIVSDFSYGVLDSDNRYILRLDSRYDLVQLIRVMNGTEQIIDEATVEVGLSTGIWQQFEVDWRRDGRHSIRIGKNPQALIVAEDTHFQEGKIGFGTEQVGSDDSVYFDCLTLNGFTPPKPGLVVDSFTDSDVSEYEYVFGQTEVDTVTDPSRFGDGSLSISGNARLYSTDGLNVYPSIGSGLKAFFRSTGISKKFVLSYGLQSQSEKYDIIVEFNDGVLSLKKEGSSPEVLASQRFGGFEAGEWFKITVQWKEPGSHVIRLINDSADVLVELSALDDTWDSGGIGIEVETMANETFFVDSILTENPSQSIGAEIESNGTPTSLEVDSIQSGSFDEASRLVYSYSDGTTYSLDEYLKFDDSMKLVDNNGAHWMRVTEEEERQAQRRSDNLAWFGSPQDGEQ